MRVLAPLALALIVGLPAIAPAQAAGPGVGRPVIGGHGFPGVRHRPGYQPQRPFRGPTIDRASRGAWGAAGRRGRLGAYGAGYGYGYGGYGLPLVVEGGSREAATVPDWGYRIVTAPGIVDRPPGRPVVYVLQTGRLRGGAAPGGVDAEGEDYGPRVVTLRVRRDRPAYDYPGW